MPGRGKLRIDRIFDGVGRIRRSADTRDPAERDVVNGILTVLFEDEQLDSLRAFAAGDLSVAELREAHRKGRLTDEYLLSRIKLEAPLWATLDATIPRLGDSDRTRGRYATSRQKLERLGGLGPHAKVRDLRRVNWKRLKGMWPGRNGKPPASAADWMHLRRMISACLSEYLGDPLHHFRREVLAKIPRAKEDPRVVELSADEFWSLVEHAAPQARPGLVTIAATGFRVEEYFHCGKEHLRPATLAVHLPSGKTGADVVYVAEWLWPYIEAGIPAPVKEKWLRIHFNRARKAIGRPDLWLRDLRHMFGQLAADQGQAQANIMAAMRHETPAMTARYLRRKAKRDVAEAVGAALKRHRKGA